MGLPTGVVGPEVGGVLGVRKVRLLLAAILAASVTILYWNGGAVSAKSY